MLGQGWQLIVPGGRRGRTSAAASVT
jgi:hypothetical protein